MFIFALLDKLVPPPATGDVTAAGKATVAFIYLDIMIYNCSWGPVPWAYVPEIFPTRVRALGMGVCIAAHWLTSFIFSFSSPYMIANIGWATFLVFMALDIVSGIFCFFMIRETRGKTLETASGVQWTVAEQAYNGTAEQGRHFDEKTGEVIVDDRSGSGSDHVVDGETIVAADLTWSRK